ncbi:MULTISPECIES: hypothetical protein [unclassified Paraburkholderia]|uniref:hypothetical protein n=1 Tax=unclassified Paraburkholderia TaxID=2615204 RepID=UPI002AB007EF|nr:MULTISPECIES: hypothetical protein [unclassified Paraburkholderia]
MILPAARRNAGGVKNPFCFPIFIAPDQRGFSPYRMRLADLCCRSAFLAFYIATERDAAPTLYLPESRMVVTAMPWTFTHDHTIQNDDEQ